MIVRDHVTSAVIYLWGEFFWPGIVDIVTTSWTRRLAAQPRENTISMKTVVAMQLGDDGAAFRLVTLSLTITGI